MATSPIFRTEEPVEASSQTAPPRLADIATSPISLTAEPVEASSQTTSPPESLLAELEVAKVVSRAELICARRERMNARSADMAPSPISRTAELVEASIQTTSPPESGMETDACSQREIRVRARWSSMLSRMERNAFEMERHAFEMERELEAERDAFEMERHAFQQQIDDYDQRLLPELVVAKVVSRAEFVCARRERQAERLALEQRVVEYERRLEQVPAQQEHDGEDLRVALRRAEAAEAEVAALRRQLPGQRAPPPPSQGSREARLQML